MEKLNKLLNMELTFGFHKLREISWLAQKLLASEGGFCSMELDSSKL
jgi:hypothetical protein